MRWPTRRTLPLLSKGALAAIFIASSTFGETVPTVGVKLSTVVVTVPFQRGLSIYMESAGREFSLRAAIRSDDRLRQYAELKNKLSGPAPALGLYVSLREFCSERSSPSLCRHSAQVPTVGAPYVSSIFFHPVNDQRTYYFQHPLEEIAISNLAKQSYRFLEYTVVGNKSGEKFDCPNDGEFGLCSSTIILFNDVAVILRFARPDEKFDAELSEEYFKNFMDDLVTIFHIKRYERK